jgi:hypothetical protein
MPGEKANHRRQKWLENEGPLLCPPHHTVAIGDAYDLDDDMTTAQTHMHLQARNL